MVDVFTKRNHYNPCFWTALWNEEYFEKWVRAEQPNIEPREQLVFALNLRSNKIYKTKVANLFYEKDLGMAEITVESMKRFCLRWHPQEYDRLCEYLIKHPETLCIDFEQILSAVEQLDTYSFLLKAAKMGSLESAEHKGFLLCTLIIHAMRSHELMTSMLQSSSTLGMDKWEYFWLLKNAWANQLILERAVTPLAVGRWTFYRTGEHRFPLCDSPVIIGRNGLLAVLSPRLLLEIDLTVSVPQPETHWITRNDISSSKYREFRRRAIGNTFKAIMFHDPTVLEEWRSNPDCRKRIYELSDPVNGQQCVHEAAMRVLWAVNGFGRVPDNFET